jgi:hypothetical protein
MRTATGAALAALLVVTAACAGDADVETVVPDSIQHEVARVGEEAAQSLRAGLSQRLMAAIAANGPAAAIDVCAFEAMPLTDSIAAATGFELKRTSLRIRNPRNAPDSLEVLALEWFDAHEAEAPTSLVQMDGEVYRYYSPLRTAALCTQCHGPAESLPEPVHSVLRERYPADRAVGYREGELRGLLRVSVPAAAVSNPPR